MTSISTVAVIATQVGILGIGLKTERESQVTREEYKQQVGARLNSVVLDA